MMEGVQWPDEDDLAQQLEGIMSAPLSAEEQDALAKEINRIFEEYGDLFDSVLSPPGDAAPEERTTAPSSFQSNTTPEMEDSIQIEREQNIADDRRQSSASPSIVDWRNGQLIGGDNGGDDRDLRSLPVLFTRLNYGRTTLSLMQTDDEDDEGTGNVAIPKDNPNEGLASAPATFASDDRIGRSGQATSSNHEGHASWPLERHERNTDLLNGRPNTDTSRLVTSPTEQATAHLWARANGSARPLPFPFKRDPRLYLPGLAHPGMTTAQSADQALRMPARFMVDAGLPWNLQMNSSAPAVGGPSPSDANPPSSRLPFGESLVDNASLALTTALRQREAGPSRRQTRIKKVPRPREPESSRTCTLETCKKFGKIYNCRKDLLRHVKHGKDHRGQSGSLLPLVCPLCLKELSRNDSVNRHLRRIHGVSTASLF